MTFVAALLDLTLLQATCFILDVVETLFGFSLDFSICN